MTVQIHNSRYERIQQKAEPVINHLIDLLRRGYALSTASSFGKDSSVVLVLFFEALKRAKAQGISLPRCYISHSNTGIENPAMDSYTGEMLSFVDRFIEQHNLDVEVVLAEPSLSASFMYATVGRGKLPRFVDSKARECSVDWKVKPQQRALKRIRKQAGEGRDLVVLVGTRNAESAVRNERMENAGHSATSLVPEEGQTALYSNACIADWEMTDIWELLMACDSERNGVYATYVPNFEHTLALYKASNEGTCAVIVGDGGNKAACGSRHGCGICTVAGKKDRSMSAMIESEPETFGYLDGINRLRNFIVRTQHDFDRREWFQRRISDVGYVALSPDNYSSRMRRDLLRYMLTLDVREQERAEEHSAALHRGDIPDTPVNRRLAHPQFEWITPKMLLAIDFAWGIYGQFSHAFPALREWYEVVHLGRRYEIPEVGEDEYLRIPVPEKRYFYIGAYEHPWKIDGLRNAYGEAKNPARRPDRPPFGAYRDPETGETRRVAYFEERDELSIDGAEANLFLLEFEDIYFETLALENYDGVRYLLDRGLVKVGKGQIATYDQIARRAQHWIRLGQDLNVMDIQDYARDHSISKAEHFQLMEEHQRQIAANVDDQFNLDLFAEAAA
ncbi:phosphoadenosine phosphosulfate reductase family protein [Marinobacter sp. F3R08]|uniref:phosphoadenosine phosphosulfate reductase domain-containing protein n=1 Tax=Marinobacter sp. F3R08 TaxID=2841559 RepID=UPI001C08AD7E|nr:phosphoadenosine phosphosulfate reductase family protein [Marinobacter sp. F3R08]MBU2952288.1 phosphoadenosine phosphosulfate reductase family protein [Marinobacter sp. F3R08]